MSISLYKFKCVYIIYIYIYIYITDAFKDPDAKYLSSSPAYKCPTWVMVLSAGACWCVCLSDLS